LVFRQKLKLDGLRDRHVSLTMSGYFQNIQTSSFYTFIYLRS